MNQANPRNQFKRFTPGIFLAVACAGMVLSLACLPFGGWQNAVEGFEQATRTPVTPTLYGTRTATLLVTPTITQTPDIKATATMFHLRLGSICPTQTPAGIDSFTRLLTHLDTLREVAGMYRRGTGRSVHDLVIDCDKTYVEKVWLDAGSLRFESGRASVQEGNMVVLDSVDPYGRFQQRLYSLVRWGPRHYLVHYGSEEDFCEAWAENSRALEGGVSDFYLRVGDEALEASGKPVNTAGQEIC